MTRSSGVICGVTLSDSTAFLNCVVVAPLESRFLVRNFDALLDARLRWFAVITRGEEMISPRPSACAADSSRSTM